MEFALMRTRTDRTRTRPWINSALYKSADEVGAEARGQALSQVARGEAGKI